MLVVTLLASALVAGHKCSSRRYSQTTPSPTPASPQQPQQAPQSKNNGTTTVSVGVSNGSGGVSGSITVDKGTIQQLQAALKSVVDRIQLPQTSNFRDDCLKSHNIYRSLVGMPPLTYDLRLEAIAQNWANHLAATGKFEHSNGDTGENLAKGIPSGSGSIKAWFAEFELYNGEPINQTPALFHEYGHVYQSNPVHAAHLAYDH
jgi:uncharacterized protein YkwD